ncbi:MAG: MBL fold metallo-hydrolase [Synergistaceae bacterium]|jgi:glyoxylase-like metal-dependent hydrolase (beta-lactamase superfamily II)|nr:MBL fold metallo-hydrolase [Synergistaceae bacterium]
MKIKRFPLGPLWTNCYVISSGDGDAVAVDPGGPVDEVREYLRKGGLRLRLVMLTHGHGDHIFGVGELRGDASDGVAIHTGDSDCLTSAYVNMSEDMGLPVSFAKADRLLNDGDVISYGGLNIRVIHTPGHTRGGCCFYVTEGGSELLISGDTLFARSIGRSDLPGGDEGVLIESLRKLEGFNDSLAVYPGHGPSTTIGDERRLNPFWPR